jgi:hypothetical protein
MAVYDFAWRWLAHAAVGGLIVLALGSLAARLCNQPVRRARIVVLTLLGAFAVPWLGALAALGVSDRPSNLYRRVAMHVQDHEPLEHRCR